METAFVDGLITEILFTMRLTPLFSTTNCRFLLSPNGLSQINSFKGLVQQGAIVLTSHPNIPSLANYDYSEFANSVHN
jgi:hypothetical protein